VLRPLFLLLLVLALPAGAADDERHGGQEHGFDDAEQWAAVFDDPDRPDWQRPIEVAELLGLRPGQTVVDLGAGTGFFVRYLATAVGAEGKVYAVEIEPAMIDYIASREDLARFGDAVVPVLAEPDDPRLPDGEVHLILVVNTWHHIENRVAYLDRLRRSLRRNGRVAIIDWREGELPVGPPPNERLSRDTVQEEFDRAGWRLEMESVLLPYQYFLVFRPPS
jgi:SAM-dependent methyltransferase